MAFPFLRWVKSFAKPLQICRKRRNEAVEKLIHDRVSLRDKKEETYIDLTHQLVVEGEMTKYEEIADTMVLFIAGTDTTSITLGKFVFNKKCTVFILRIIS